MVFILLRKATIDIKDIELRLNSDVSEILHRLIGFYSIAKMFRSNALARRPFFYFFILFKPNQKRKTR